MYLQEKARVIRRDILTMIAEAGSGHPGGSLSAVEIVTALYFNWLRLDPARPDWPDRDFFILSKGHAAPVLYAALAERGFFPRLQLWTLRQLGSPLQGHPDRSKLPGVEMSTGSLGQGFSVACGLSLACRLDRRPSRIYVLLGDGEAQEGLVWEAAMAAAHYHLDNLCVFLDSNGLQIDGRVREVMSLEPLAQKWQSFGWHVIGIQGHNYSQIFTALGEAGRVRGQPTMILAETVKGKGVSFMENQVGWHGTAPTREELDLALAELGSGN